MPFVSPIPISEQSPSSLLKSRRYGGPCDIKLPTAPKSTENGFSLNPGTHVTTRTNRTEAAFVPDSYTTKRENQHSDAYPNAQPQIIGSDENHNTEPSAEAQSHGRVRKRSGEIVKSSLKNDRLRGRARSLPSIPTSSKEVHFDAQLERVRHFFHSERPAAISQEGSPADEDPFSCFPWSGAKIRIEHSQFLCPSGSPVYMEALNLSSEGSMLVGQILVKNIAYHKNVAVRFTFDHWRTISETSAFYDARLNDQTNPKDDAYDRFTFHIKLRDFICHFSSFQGMDFCVRYNVANQEFWDNNFGNNYRVSFTKPHYKPEHPKRAKSCPPSLNTEACSPAMDRFFELVNEHLEIMADLDDAKLWAASLKKHGIQGPIYKNLEQRLI